MANKTRRLYGHIRSLPYPPHYLIHNLKFIKKGALQGVWADWWQCLEPSSAEWVQWEVPRWAGWADSKGAAKGCCRVGWWRWPCPPYPHYRSSWRSARVVLQQWAKRYFLRGWWRVRVCAWSVSAGQSCWSWWSCTIRHRRGRHSCACRRRGRCRPSCVRLGWWSWLGSRSTAGTCSFAWPWVNL